MNHEFIQAEPAPRLYLRLEDVLLFLARLSTARLEDDIDHGAVTDSLILQDQWAKVSKAQPWRYGCGNVLEWMN